HVVLHERKDLFKSLVFVMMRIHVDDQHIVEMPLVRLLARMREQPARVQLLDRNAAAAVSDQIHESSPISGAVAALFIDSDTGLPSSTRPALLLILPCPLRESILAEALQPTPVVRGGCSSCIAWAAKEQLQVTER